MIVFGSLLNGRNWADTATSIGAAYDPRSNTWRRIPASALSPQATSAVWVGDRMLAWDYETRWQEYDPVGNRWGPPLGMPLQFNECYPDTAKLRGQAFAFFCGDAALFDGRTRSWGVIHGGMLDSRIPANGRHYALWRFASLAPAGTVLFLAAEGITVDASGVPCYGCPGSPHSFWAYRPPRTVPHVAPKVAHGKRAARRVAEDFMDARIRRSHPLIQWLITPRASRMFGDPEAGVTEPLLSGRTYRLFGASLVGRHPTTFWVRVKLFLGRGAVSNEALLIGPGRTLGGTHAA